MIKHHWILRSQLIRANAAAIIGALPVTDKPLEIIVRPHVRDRSGAQNRLYWQWVTQIANSAGWHKDAVHEDLAKRFLPLIEQAGPDGVRQIRTSTASLNVREFTDYLRSIEVFAAEWGIELTYPADYGWIMGQRAAA